MTKTKSKPLTTQEKINKLNVKEIKNYFSEETVGLTDREDELKQLMYAVLTKEHMLLTGPAGTGKSQFAIRALEQITKARLFSIHLTKQTTEEYVFGPLDIQEFKKGNIKHNIDEGILKADFAFIDEFFDASDVLLRSLLGVLNERKWMKVGTIDAPLHTAVLTSNYNRNNEVTEAILDRIIFKAEIKPLKDKENRLIAYNSYLGLTKTNKNLPKISLQQIQEAADIIEDPEGISFTKDVLKIYDKLFEAFQEEFQSTGAGLTDKENSKYISQRTLHKGLKVVKASALLDGRDTVEFPDLGALRYVFCTTNNKEESAFFDAVYQKVVANAQKDLETEEAIKELSQELVTYPSEADLKKIKDEHELIDVCTKLTAFAKTVTDLSDRTNNTSLKKKIGSVKQDADNLKLIARKKLDELIDPSTDSKAEKGEIVEEEELPF